MTSQWFIEAYDPGEATGYAFGWFGDGGGFTPISFQTLTPGEVRAKITNEWPRTLDRIRVVETFRLRGSNNFVANIQAAEIIGAMKLGAHQNPDMKPIVWQSRSDKALIHDNVLRDGGVWRTPGQIGFKTGRHVNDATKHILIYLWRQRHQPTLKKFGL